MIINRDKLVFKQTHFHNPHAASLMFVLSFHRACKEFEIFCASMTRNVNAVSSRADLCRLTSETESYEESVDAILGSCNLFQDDEVSRFIRHCIRIKKYFHGDNCKVEYMRSALLQYDENVSEL